MTALPLEPHTEAEESAVVRVAQAIRDSNGTPEAHAAWKRHPQLIPAEVYAAAAIEAMKGGSPEAETLARLHHAQAGALASLAEQLEDAGHPEAAALADREAAIYTTWALLPEGPPPNEPLPREERARLIQERRAAIAVPVAIYDRAAALAQPAPGGES